MASNIRDAIKLGETGFQPFDIMDGMHLYRKRKISAKRTELSKSKEKAAGVR